MARKRTSRSQYEKEERLYQAALLLKRELSDVIRDRLSAIDLGSAQERHVASMDLEFIAKKLKTLSEYIRTI